MRLKCKLSLCPCKPAHAGTPEVVYGDISFSTLHCRDFLFSIFFSSHAQKTQKRK